MDKLTKELFFGADLAGDMQGLSFGNFGLSLKDMGIEEVDLQEKNQKNAKNEKIEKENKTKQKPSSNKKKSHPSINDLKETSLPSAANDLNLKILCIHDGEKIYKLSDLFIPEDLRVIKKIEKYNKKIMSISERLKGEKDSDQKEKINEATEMKHLIRKARRNQKFTKINVTYNEKFFLENIATDKLISSTINESVKDSERKKVSEINTQEYNIETAINKEKTVENNLLNSLFYVQMKLKENRPENTEPEQDENNKNFKNKNNNKETQVLDEEFEIEEMNRSIKEYTKKIGERYITSSLNQQNNSFVFNDNYLKEDEVTNTLFFNNFNNPEFNIFDLKNSNLLKEARENFEKFADYEEMSVEENENIIKESNINQAEKPNLISNENFPAENITVKDLDLNDGNKSLDESTSRIYETRSFDKEFNIFKFKQEKENVDTFDLYDYIKRKRHRAQGYVNEKMLNGKFINSLVLSDQDVPETFKGISKKIFDMNDYNMNFELLQTDAIERQKKEKELQMSQINLNTSLNNAIGEDFFNQTNQKTITPITQQSSLKIGKAKGNLLTHAKCAYNLLYNKINLTYEDLKDFHRPNFCKYLAKEKKKRNFSITISDKFNISHQSKNKRWDCTILTRNYLKKKEKKRISRNIQYMNAYEIFKDRFKLSLVDGKFCLFEHLDEHPLFVSNFGMASKLKKFLYSSKLLNVNVTNSSNKLTETELKTYNMIGPFGIQIPLQPGQKLPLIGQIEQNEQKGLAVMDNKMYRAPVFYEKLMTSEKSEKSEKTEKSEKIEAETKSDNFQVKQENTSKPSQFNKKYMNFLITFKKSKEGQEGFYIRELDHLYTVAQEEPKIEVYPPQSRQYVNFFKNKIKTYTYKLYDEIGYKAGINFKVFTNLFPNATEQILKKNFREMKIEIDKNICYFTRLPNEDHQMLVTPENLCQFESCQFGIFKLREVGIKNLTNPDKISYATNKFLNQTPDLKQQFLAKVIEEELLTTPWNITQNFLQAKQIKGMLAIKGIGDPSNGQGGYSFLKMPVKTYNDNKTLKEEIDQLKIMNKNIKTVTGTDADLRKLSKDDIKLKLIQLGEDEEYINKLSRWERVSLLRYKSSKAAELGYEGDITKYARGMRMNSKVQRDAYQKNINEVFKKQIQYITSKESQVFEDESEDEEVEQVEPSGVEEDILDEDKKKGLGFMRNETYSSELKKKKKESRRLGLITLDGRKGEEGKIIKVYNKHKEMGSEEFAFPKIKLDMKSGVAEYLQRKKKSSNSFDNVFEYEMDKASTLVSRKRRDTPEKLFNELIEDIVDSCIKNDLTKVFHQPVKKKDYPDYYDIIKQPIDLSTMKNKTKRNEYKSINSFTADMDLLVHNSMIYNGESHDVTNQAVRLKQLVENKLADHDERLKELEKKVQDDTPSIVLNN